MNVTRAGPSAASVAAAIGEPARARMLYALLDGRARTPTELAAVAGVTPATASGHLRRLTDARLVRVVAQGRHRYCQLQSADVAAALEALSVVAGDARATFVPTTPSRLVAARTCYDHIAGRLGVAVHDRFVAAGWLARDAAAGDAYRLTSAGERLCVAVGVDVVAALGARRRFAFPCLDWSERRPHLGGALGAAILATARRRRWVSQDLDSRALTLTAAGRHDLRVKVGVSVP